MIYDLVIYPLEVVLRFSDPDCIARTPGVIIGIVLVDVRPGVYSQLTYYQLWN